LWQRGNQPFHVIDRGVKTLKGEKVDSGNTFWSFSPGKHFLEGNGVLMTEYLQQALGKNSIKVAYIGDNYLSDIYATHELDVKLQAKGNSARWESIVVMEEMVKFDKTFSTRHVKPLHFAWDKDTWGDSYFYHFSGEHPAKMKKWPIKDK
jgi:hypothetical protein